MKHSYRTEAEWDIQPVSAGETNHWMSSLEIKSPRTYRHCVRVSLLAEKIAPYMRMGKAEKEALIRGCYLHDIGKLFVPSSILEQEGGLTEQQWKIVKLHPELGSELLMEQIHADSIVVEVVRYHHERWDGTGYPNGLREGEIPLHARICSVLDAFDCMLTTRSYRKPVTFEQAAQELRNHRYTQFDGEIVDLFLGLSEQIADLYYFFRKY